MDKSVLYEQTTKPTSSPVEFIEHPKSVYLSGKLPVIVQCIAKNAAQTYMECNNKIREDAKRNVTRKENVKYDTLSLMVKRKEFEKNTYKKLTCKCVAYSENSNEKLMSNKAIIQNSCKYKTS